MKLILLGQVTYVQLPYQKGVFSLTCQYQRPGPKAQIKFKFVYLSIQLVCTIQWYIEIPILLDLIKHTHTHMNGTGTSKIYIQACVGILLWSFAWANAKKLEQYYSCSYTTGIVELNMSMECKKNHNCNIEVTWSNTKIGTISLVSAQLLNCKLNLSMTCKKHHNNRNFDQTSEINRKLQVGFL